MNLKLHLLVSTVFLLLIFGALFAFSMKEMPSNEGSNTPATDRFIQVMNASWGENCNPQIEAIKQKAEAEGSDTPISQQVKKNNVLRLISAVCNGKEQCQFPVSAATFKFDPMAKCQKILEVEYRCFEIDRTQIVQLTGDGDMLINCAPDAEDTQEIQETP